MCFPKKSVAVECVGDGDIWDAYVLCYGHDVNPYVLGYLLIAIIRSVFHGMMDGLCFGLICCGIIQ